MDSPPQLVLATKTIINTSKGKVCVPAHAHRPDLHKLHQHFLILVALYIFLIRSV